MKLVLLCLCLEIPWIIVYNVRSTYMLWSESAPSLSLPGSGCGTIKAMRWMPSTAPWWPPTATRPTTRTQSLDLKLAHNKCSWQFGQICVCALCGLKGWLAEAKNRFLSPAKYHLKRKSSYQLDHRSPWMAKPYSSGAVKRLLGRVHTFKMPARYGQLLATILDS